MAVMSFLAGLRPEFDTVKSQILSSPEISSLQETFTRILRTENSVSIGLTPSQPNSALISRTDPGRLSNRRGGSTSSRDNRSQDSGGVVCYYCHEPGHTKRTCRKLQNRNQKNPSAHIASTNATSDSSSEKTVTISADELAKFSQYQEAMKSSSHPITAVAQSGKPTTCLLSSSSKWVIDSGATDHITGNPSLFFTF